MTSAILRLLAIAFLALPVQAGELLYRYTNAEGHVVIDDKVPSELVGQGYEVINRQGQVVEVVPPELNPAQRAEAERAAQAAKDAEAAREHDRNLLLRYSTVEDIEAARDRALSELRMRLRILESNQRTLKLSLASYQSEAADAERRGAQIDPGLLKEIDNAQEELRRNEQRIVQRQVELDAAAAAYASDIERFEQILDLVRVRQETERKRSSRPSS